MTDLKGLQKQLAKIAGSISKLSGEQETLLFGVYASEYLKLKLSNPTLREATKASFKNQVEKHLIPAFGKLPLDQIKNGNWLHWVSDMREEKKMTRFFNARKSLIEILRDAREEGHLEKLPKLDNPDAPANAGRALTEREVLSVLWHSRRPFRFIFYVFWKMGCRPREILRWEWSMIRWIEGRMWIDIPARISKNDRSRSIPINSDVSRILLSRMKAGNNSIFVFPHRCDFRRPQLSYQSAWTTACLGGGVVDAVPYDLRRTYITQCAKEGKPLIYVAKLLDTSIEMIERVYAKMDVKTMEDISR